MIPEDVKVEKGDLVECKFHSLHFEGTVVDIDDGTKTRVPGELMYFVEIPNQGTVWLKRYELIKKLDPEGAFHDAVKTFTRPQLQIARRKFNAAIARIVAAKGTVVKKFKGVL